jgi:hypothetical protein
MDELWDAQIEQLLRNLGPDSFRNAMRKFEADADDEEWLYEAAQVYTAMPVSLLVASMFSLSFKTDSPLEALSQMEARLNDAWRTLIDERDTTSLSQSETEHDDVLVETIERIRGMVEGLLAILKNYAGGDDDPGRDTNELILQASRMAASNLPEARRQFGQAGASVLRGAPYWPLWELELDLPPIARWMAGLEALYRFLIDNDLFPLAPFAEQRGLMEARIAQRQAMMAATPDEPFDPFERKLTPDTKRLMDVLLSGKQKLSDKQRKSLPPLTPEVVRQLIHVLESGNYDLDDSPGKGWAPIHAAELLGKSGSPLAVAPLIRIVEENDIEAIVYSQALFALQELGEAALPMLLDTMRFSTDLTLKCSLADPLGHVGKGDERAFRALEALYNETTWDDERMLAMMGLAELGDRRAVEIFHRALKSDRDITPEGIREIMGALEELEPEADPAQLQQLEEQAMRRYDNRFVRFDNKGNAFCRDCGSLMRRGFLGEWDHVEPDEDEPILPARPPLSIPLPSAPALDPRFAGVGRNEPCPCGSGRKFKHCHGAPKQTVH